MAYSSAEGRQEILDALGEAIEALATALAVLGVAYEEVDERSGDQLEEELFGPVQKAYGRARKTYTGFAQRMAMEADDPEAAMGGGHEGGRASIDHAVTELARADAVLSELQDGMLPVEVGDRELREGLSGVRELIAPLPVRARELIRTLGR
ncbi:MAG TPA: hypothetical protein VIL49_16560 [Capillimicrobium sp.]|jgi:hypothetical protein